VLEKLYNLSYWKLYLSETLRMVVTPPQWLTVMSKIFVLLN